MSFSEPRRSQEAPAPLTSIAGLPSVPAEYLRQVFDEGAAGHDAVAPPFAGGEGQVFLDVREETDHGHVPRGVAGLKLLQELQGLEARRVQVEDEEVGGILGCPFEKLLRG